MAARQPPKDFNPIFDPTKFLTITNIVAVNAGDITTELEALQADLDLYAAWLSYYCIVNLSIVKPFNQAGNFNSGVPTLIFSTSAPVATRGGGLWLWNVGVYPQSGTTTAFTKCLLFLTVNGVAQQYIVWNDPYYSRDNGGGLQLNQYSTVPLLGTFAFFIDYNTTAVVYIYMQCWTADGTTYKVGPPGNANTYIGSSISEFRIGNGL